MAGGSGLARIFAATQFKGAEVLSIEVIESENALNGLLFKTDKGGFSIIDAGDVIAGILGE